MQDRRRVSGWRNVVVETDLEFLLVASLGIEALEKSIGQGKERKRQKFREREKYHVVRGKERVVPSVVHGKERVIPHC
jgi:hypothetical protein